MESSATDTGDTAAHLLTSALAQRVVDQVKPRLSHGINVMDRTGRIIGSVDPTRIGTIHEGAVHAIDENRIVIVHAPDDSAGVKPGVNIPLMMEGELIGAIGVTGDPAEVQPVGELIALTVELLVKEERQRDNWRWREDAVRQVILGLANGAMGEAGLVEALRRIGSPLTPPWNIVILTSAGAPGAAVPPEQLSTLLRRVGELPNVVATELQGALWILHGSANDRSLTQVQIRLQRNDIRAVSGKTSASTSEVAAEAHQLKVLLSAPGLLPRRPLTWLTDLAAECAVASQPAELSARLVETAISPLSPPLRLTARTFLDENLSIVSSAAALDTHRNTLVQRLERIEHLVGLDLRRFDHAMIMRLALLSADATSASQLSPDVSALHIGRVQQPG